MVLFRRQLEYLCVWCHFTFLCMSPVYIILVLPFLVYSGTLGRLLASIYLTFTWFNRNKGTEGGYTTFQMPSSYFRRIRDYFPAVLHLKVDLNPEKSYLMGLHPHGILPLGYSALISYLADQRSSFIFHACYTAINFRLPFLRDYTLAATGISATEESMMGVLNKPGQILGIYVGGAKESLHNNENVLVLKNRKGFCRLALKSGATLVPTYSFGDNDLFTSVKFPENSWVRKTQNWLVKMTSVSLPIVKGPMRFQYQLVMPRRRPINFVVGEPIHVERVENPTKGDIEKLHEKYLASLKKLFDDHKVRFGESAEAELTFV